MPSPKPYWVYDPISKRYRNLRTGRYIDQSELTRLRDEFADALRRETDRIAQRMFDGTISIQQWVSEMRTLIKDAYIAQYAAAIGGIQNMTQSDYGRIGAMLSSQNGGQYLYLQQFAEAIARGELSEAQIRARAAMYGYSSVQAFERGRASSFGLALPAYPGDGSTRCLCITSPQSRVLTSTGWKALADIEIGEFVLTHRLRWRRVLAKIIKPSQAYHRQVYLRAGGGAWVGATDNHRWFTAGGWQDANGISNSLDMVYNLRIENMFGGLDHETILRSLQCSPVQPKQANGVQGLPVSLRMRTDEGLSGASLPVMRVARQGAGAMERCGDTQRDAGRNAEGRQTSAHNIRGAFPGNKVASSHRWSALDVVLGGRTQANDLSLSLGMDQGARNYTARLPYSSQEWRQNGRPLRELGTDAAPETRPATRGGGAQRVTEAHDGLSMRTVRTGVSQATTQGATAPFLLNGLPRRLDEVADAGVDMLALRTQVQETTGSRGNAEILFGDMLPVGTALYDLTVEEDHSFVIEGMFAHNSNCRCSWQITESNTAWFCTWTLGRAEHCPDCLVRAATWAPLVILKSFALNTLKGVVNRNFLDAMEWLAWQRQ